MEKELFARLMTKDEYGQLIEDLELTKSFQLKLAEDRYKVLQYIKKKYGETRIYRTISDKEKNVHVFRLK